MDVCSKYINKYDKYYQVKKIAIPQFTRHNSFKLYKKSEAGKFQTLFLKACLHCSKHSGLPAVTPSALRLRVLNKIPPLCRKSLNAKCLLRFVALSLVFMFFYYVGIRLAGPRFKITCFSVFGY